MVTLKDAPSRVLIRLGAGETDFEEFGGRSGKGWGGVGEGGRAYGRSEERGQVGRWALTVSLRGMDSELRIREER